MSAVEEAAMLRAKLRQTQLELAAAKDAQVRHHRHHSHHHHHHQPCTYALELPIIDFRFALSGRRRCREEGTVRGEIQNQKSSKPTPKKLVLIYSRAIIGSGEAVWRFETIVRNASKTYCVRIVKHRFKRSQCVRARSRVQ